MDDVLGINESDVSKALLDHLNASAFDEETNSYPMYGSYSEGEYGTVHQSVDSRANYSGSTAFVYYGDPVFGRPSQPELDERFVTEVYFLSVAVNINENITFCLLFTGRLIHYTNTLY